MIHDISGAVTPASVSLGATSVSFFATTLPVLQWFAAAVAISSGFIAVAWVVAQWREQLKRKSLFK